MPKNRGNGMPDDAVILFAAIAIYSAGRSNGTTPAMAFEAARDFTTTAKRQVPDCFENDEDDGD